MKKYIFIIVIAATISTSCKSPHFYYSSDSAQKLALEHLTIDDSYHLYVRSVCKNDDGIPINCPSVISEGVETQFLFLSPTKEKVLVINNVPNRNQKFYQKGPGKTLVGSELEFNMFFFKQFRFGNLVKGAGDHQLRFVTTEKDLRTFVWEYKIQHDTLTILSVQTQLQNGFNLMHTDQSLSLIPQFREVKRYKFMFQIPEPIEANAPKVEWTKLIYLDKKSRRNIETSFVFDSPVNDQYRTITFGKNRMYAYFRDE